MSLARGSRVRQASKLQPLPLESSVCSPEAEARENTITITPTITIITITNVIIIIILTVITIITITSGARPSRPFLAHDSQTDTPLISEVQGCDV